MSFENKSQNNSQHQLHQNDEIVQTPSIKEDTTSQIRRSSQTSSKNPSGWSRGQDVQHETKEEQPIILTKRNELLYMICVCWSMFIAGWQDGSAGPLIPSLQVLFKVNYTMISMIFITGFIGFASAGILNLVATDRLGFGKVVVIASVCQIIGYALQFWYPPFPVFAISFLIIGFGTSWQDAQTNSIVNRFEKPEMRMQFLHAAYGIGATTAPLVATLFVTHIHRFYHYYIVSLCLAISNFILLVFVFRFKRTEELVGGDGSWKGEMGREEKKMLKREAKEREGQIELQDGGGVQRNEDGVNMEMSVIGNPRLSKVEEGVPVISNDENSGKKFKRILRDKRVYCLAVFLLLYVGLEVTIGGWIVSYIIEYRSGTATSGYISTGFYGGLTVGRLVLIPLNKKLGDVWAIYIYLLCCLAFEFIVWFVPNLIANAVAVCIMGVFLGPIYPLCMNWCARSFAPSLVSGIIGLVAGVGSAGSCLFPFLTGALASRYGVKVLQPVVVAMVAGCLIMWWIVPKRVKRE